MNSRFVKYTLVVASGLAAPASPVFAQSNEEKVGLEEIVVTSQRRSENIQNVPISITAITSDMLERSNINLTEDLGRLTPGLTIDRFGSFVGAYIRGIGTKFSQIGLEPTVSTYVDDFYSPRTATSTLDFVDVERVEVLKGPQGTLYGRNSTGGAIRVITKDPTSELGGSAALTYGRFGQVRADGVINLPLNDIVSSRFAVTYDTYDGYIKAPLLNHRLGDLNQFKTSGKIKILPSDNLTILLQGSYAQKRDWSGPYLLQVLDSPLNNTATALGGTAPTDFYSSGVNASNLDSEENKVDVWNVGANIDWRLDGVTLTSISGFQHYKLSSGTDADGTNLTFQHQWTPIDQTNNFTQELRAVSTGDGPWKWTGGLYYYHETDANETNLYGLSVPGNNALYPVNAQSLAQWFAAGGSALTTDASLSGASYAGYAQTTYNLTEKIALTAGGRYTWEEKKLDAHSFQQRKATVALASFTETPNELTFKRFTPKVGLEFRPLDHVLLYADWSTGYKSGGFSLPALSATTPAVGPEKLKAWEVGWKTQFERVRFDGSLYYYDYSDIQVSRKAQGATIPIVVNAAKAEVYGIEGDVQFAATDRLSFSMGASWVHTGFTDFFGDKPVANTAINSALCANAVPGPTSPVACRGFTILGSQDLSGNRLPYAPELTGNFNVQYAMPVGSAGTIILSSLTSYTSSLFFAYDPAYGEEPSHVLVSAAGTWISANDRYSVTLSGNNLTDEKIRTNSSFTSLGASYAAGPPLWWSIKAGVRF